MTTNGYGGTQPPPIGEQFARGRAEARGLGQEIGDIVGDLRELGTLEIALLRADLMQQVAYARSAAIWGAVAALFGLVLLFFIFFTVMFALDTVFELWLASLITTGIVLLLAAIAGIYAYTRIRRITVTPQRSMDSLRRDVQWAQELMTSRSR